MSNVGFAQSTDTNKHSFLIGKKFNVDVFVEIKSDTAIVFWFYQESVPRYYFSDTLLLNKTEPDCWLSKSSKIYKKKERLFLDTKSPYDGSKNFIVKLKESKITFWKTEFNTNRKFYTVRH
jgi:hypothetical protein